MKKISILLMCSLFIAACARMVEVTPSPTYPVSIATASVTPSPIVDSAPLAIHTSLPKQTPTQVPPATLEPLVYPAPVIYDQPGPLYDAILRIPVGEDGILYRGAGVEDMQPVGPNGLVVTQDGVMIIGDVFGNRLLRYDLAGHRLADIDLAGLGILNISDLVLAGNDLYILEVSFAVLPERYRISQLTTTGNLVRQYDLPEGYHFEDGLFGLAIGYLPDGSEHILVQLDNADNSSYYTLPAEPDGMPEKLPARPVFGEDLQIQSAGQEELAVLSLGMQEFISQVTSGGTIFLLSARADGSLYLERDDLIAWDPIVTTDITIHYISPTGKPAAMARYPLMDWYFPIYRFLTVGPDGNVYALITRQESVDILRLNFYPQLEPQSPGAIKPSITNTKRNNLPEDSYDCSGIQHYLPDSSEAQQIVQSFTKNFLQTWPTEYMAFEQLWSVDQVAEYAIIQGMVTAEESDIIVAQATDRGYEMVARYTSHMVLPGFRHQDIGGYLLAQVPGAPEELFYCLDLSHFTGSGD